MMGNADIGGGRLRFWVASHLVLESNNGQWPNEASMGEYEYSSKCVKGRSLKQSWNGLIHLDFIHLDLSR